MFLEFLKYFSLVIVGLMLIYMVCYMGSRGFFKGYFEEQHQWLQRLTNDEGDSTDGKG